MKRALSVEEKEDILSSMYTMHPDPNFEEKEDGSWKMNPDTNFVIQNARRQISIQLDQIEIYPEAIPKLKEEILRQYGLAYVSPGEMVGCVAATSVGEGMTQDALNSVIGSTRVVIYRPESAHECEIGSLINEAMETNANSVSKMVYNGYTEKECIMEGNKLHDISSEQVHHPFVEVMDVSNKGWKISSVDNKGQVRLQTITQLIRHPVYSGLIKVTTASGRTVVATTGESFLTIKDGEIVPIYGSELQVGDSLPITWKGVSVDVKDTVNLRQWFSPKEYVYGTELWKAREYRDKCLIRRKEKGNKLLKWWDGNGIYFTLPYNRGDSAMFALEGNHKNKEGKETLLPEYIYMMNRTKDSKAEIPENIPLDELTGFFIGAYLADGCVTDHYVTITKGVSREFLKRIEDFSNRWKIGWHSVSIGYKYKYNNKYDDLHQYNVTPKRRDLETSEDPYDVRIHNMILAIWLKETCGKGSLNKRIPDFAYTAPESFLRGLFDGLFSGDGSVDTAIDYSSISERLLDGMIYLLGRWNIFVHKSRQYQPSTNRDTKIIHPCWIISIRGSNVITFGERIGQLTHRGKHEKLMNLLPKKYKKSSILNDKESRYKNPVVEDILLDRITSIDPINTTEIKWVYDFSVEETKNFGILCALNMRDSFHASGSKKAELTSGVPRFKELLELSKQMKTPSVTIYFNPTYSNQVQKSEPNSLRFVREIIHTQLVYVKMVDLIQSYSIDVNPHREWWYGSFSRLYSDAHRECTHRIRLQLNAGLLFKHQKDMAWIAAKIERDIKSKGLMHIAFSDNYTAQLDIWLDPSNISSCENILAMKEMEADDKEKIMSYITDANKAEVCLRNVVLPSVKLVSISGISGIQECYTSEPTDMKEKEYTITTKGGTLRDIISLECVDVRRCESNNVHEIYKLFGIEAAFRFLVKEFEKICKVSRRHLDVMIEWMCQTGKLASVNRHGQDIAKIGPMAKASFEQPLDAFIKAASTAQTEVITGVSASIATGNLPRIGTGSFQMLLDLEKLIKYTPIEDESSIRASVPETEESIPIEEYEEEPEYDYEDYENQLLDENEML